MDLMLWMIQKRFHVQENLLFQCNVFVEQNLVVKLSSYEMKNELYIYKLDLQNTIFYFILFFFILGFDLFIIIYLFSSKKNISLLWRWFLLDKRNKLWIRHSLTSSIFYQLWEEVITKERITIFFNKVQIRFIKSHFSNFSNNIINLCRECVF